MDKQTALVSTADRFKISLDDANKIIKKTVLLSHFFESFNFDNRFKEILITECASRMPEHLISPLLTLIDEFIGVENE